MPLCSLLFSLMSKIGISKVNNGIVEILPRLLPITRRISMRFAVQMFYLSRATVGSNNFLVSSIHGYGGVAGCYLISSIKSASASKAVQEQRSKYPTK